MTASLAHTADGSPVTVDLDRLIGSHALIVANPGGGKSGMIRRLLEVTHGKVQHIVLDSEDEFYTLRQGFDYVIAGGDGGDVPATVANAEGLALAALTHGFSMIVQLNSLGRAGAAQFVDRFCEAMIDAPESLWCPCLVVIDEAHRFAPATGGPSASGVAKLTGEGRKRGFTAVLASQRITKLHPDVRGDCNNWMLGRVGQTLDRNAVADALGFSAKEGRERLMGMAERSFWGFGPAVSREPVQFITADTETHIVKSGQAKVATPPAPEALREILAGLAVGTPEAVQGSKLEPEVAKLDPDFIKSLPEWRALEAKIDEMKTDHLIERAEGQRQLDALLAENAAIREAAARIAEAAADIARINPAFDDAKAFVAEIASQKVEPEGTGVEDKPPVHSRSKEPLRPAIRKDGPLATLQSGSDAREARPRVTPSGSAPSPAALAIADLLDRVNPARLTWEQAAATTGRKASGGNFNAARKWLRESGRIFEDGGFIKSSNPAPAGLTRDEAFNLWHGVLSSPAPKMMAALRHAGGTVTKEKLAEMIGAQPRGGNWNSGVAQLRRNGVIITNGDLYRLATPLPGEGL